MRRILPVVLSLSVVLVGCKAKEALDKVAAAKDLDKRSTVDVLKEASNDKYDPPADGKLTDAQVQMYLKVRDRERIIAQAAKEKLKQNDEAAKKAGDKSLAGVMAGLKGLNNVGEFLTADIRAAKDLGFNTAEYTWVKGQVLGASAQAMGDKMAEAMNASLEASYQQMKKARDEAKDEATKKMYQESLDQFDKNRAETAAQKQQQDPAVAYNKQLLSKYESALNAYTNELAKYEDKQGDAKKSVDEWQKGLDKAKADAQKN